MRKGLRKRLMTFALVGALAFMPMSGRISRVSADEDESSEETINSSATIRRFVFSSVIPVSGLVSL